MKPCKSLRHYQARLITDVLRASGDVLVEQPTGSGKTMEIVTLVAMQLGRFSHAVIAAPQEQIEDGFTKRDYHRVAWERHDGVAVPSVEVPKELILAARKSGLGAVKQVREYLKLRGPLDYALACTHAALNGLKKKDLPADLSGKALFLDEAHHASADGLSEIVSIWRERGGRLFFFTATPYRGDDRPVALEGMKSFRRSLAEHMADGFAPGHLDSEIVALGKPGDSITAGQFTGEEAPPASYTDALVNAICRKWLDDGKPKSIVRVPAMRGGSGGLVRRLIAALAAQGARVLDASGTAAADKQRFLDALTAEKQCHHAASRFDVMVGIQRVLEGTDWPVCSAVYCVGMPGSLNTVVQLLGRAMRLKGKDYPAAHRDRARLVFFVPCGGGSALTDLGLDHSRHALLTCCFLADHEIGQEWIVLREIRRGIEDALGKPDRAPAAAAAENEADEALDPAVRAEVEVVMANAREQILGEGREPTLGEVVQLTAKARPDLPPAALQRIAVEVLAAQSGSSGTAARQAIGDEMAKKIRIDPKVKQAMAEAFAVVLNEFRDVTLQQSVVLESVGRQVHGVTGGQMREFAERLRQAAPRPLTEEMILAWADGHHERTGEWPVVSSGPLKDQPEESWGNIDAALRAGTRSLAGGSSLPQLLARCRGVRHHLDQPRLTIEQILGWADAHRDRTGKWPTKESGPIEGAPGEVWGNINHALSLGIRGLPDGSSLARLFSKERGVRNRGDLPSLTVDQILLWADEHQERTGVWPSAKSGPIKDAPGETWDNVHQALAKGLRGLPAGSSLAKFFSQHRGRRNQKDRPPLTIEMILAWADTHQKTTGKWPRKDSGAVHFVEGETWSVIDGFLRHGGRTLPGGSSLPRLLAEKRGLRNKRDLPTLSIDAILEWADAHRQRTGKWPTQDSGEIADAPEETWKVVQMALLQGLRGLPGGTSLAQLLAEERGARNSQDLPPFTIDQVLAWADAHHIRTDKWPTGRSGPVFEAPGETWKAIDRALQAGVRGFPGGSSLAKLLAEQRGRRHNLTAPPITENQILEWADAHHERTESWPNRKSGDVASAEGEKWQNIDAALRQGQRGLPGGSSLPILLEERRGVRNVGNPPQLTEGQILAWALAFKARSGHWPRVKSGPIPEAPGEQWSKMDHALRLGLRGLPGGSSLARLLQDHRGTPNL